MRNFVCLFCWLKAFCLFNAISFTHSQSARLLTSYLPASMQALAYYIDQLQYEPLSTVAIEPPFMANATITSSDTQDILKNTTVKPTISTSTTKKPNGAWQAPSWWLQISTTNAPSTSTTKKPTNTTTLVSSSGWWQAPTWWHNPLNTQMQTTSTSTQATYVEVTTPKHAPAIFSPIQRFKTNAAVGYEIFGQLDASDTETLAELPLALIRDIRNEVEHDKFTNDVESLDNFLHLYDDNYGRDTFTNVDAVLDHWSSTSTAGKKRVPPNKPYVEFLLVYDLLKRDAKAENLSKYEGYSEEMLLQLHELSDVSAPRQLYTIFKRMLDRRDIQRSDVVARIQMLIKELGDAESDTARALQFIPAMQFLP